MLFAILRITASLLAALTASLFTVSVFMSDGGPFLDGTLVREDGDSRIYLILDGKKRWVNSAASFQAHGFSWDAVYVTGEDEMFVYAEGDPITPSSLVILPSEVSLLPDLVPFAPTDLQYDTINGRTVLRFSSAFWNQGGGPLDIYPQDGGVRVSTDVLRNAYQSIKNEQGAERFRVAGEFLWHAAHGHHHLGNVAEHFLEPVDTTAAPLLSEKVTVCLRDDRAIALTYEGAPSSGVYRRCSVARQGVSVGWADVYRYTLAGQFFDVHDLPAGSYRLWLIMNPERYFLEQRIDNNRGVTFIRIDPAKRTLDVEGWAAPFMGGTSLPNGMHVKDETGGDTYVMFQNKKRLLMTGEVQDRLSVGISIESLPRSIIDAMPVNNLVRADGRTVYALNDASYKRPLKSAEVFNAYGFSWDDVADISEEELKSYPESRYIRRLGDTIVYEILGSAKVPFLESQGAPDEEIHVINDFDFSSYYDN